MASTGPGAAPSCSSRAGHLLESPAAQAGPQTSYIGVAGGWARRQDRTLLQRACSPILERHAEQPGRRALLISVARGFQKARQDSLEYASFRTCIGELAFINKQTALNHCLKTILGQRF